MPLPGHLTQIQADSWRLSVCAHECEAAASSLPKVMSRDHQTVPKLVFPGATSEPPRSSSPEVPQSAGATLGWDPNPTLGSSPTIGVQVPAPELQAVRKAPPSSSLSCGAHVLSGGDLPHRWSASSSPTSGPSPFQGVCVTVCVSVPAVCVCPFLSFSQTPTQTLGTASCFLSTGPCSADCLQLASMASLTGCMWGLLNPTYPQFIVCSS